METGCCLPSEGRIEQQAERLLLPTPLLFLRRDVPAYSQHGFRSNAHQCKPRSTNTTKRLQTSSEARPAAPPSYSSCSTNFRSWYCKRTSVWTPLSMNWIRRYGGGVIWLLTRYRASLQMSTVSVVDAVLTGPGGQEDFCAGLASVRWLRAVGVVVW